MPDKQTIKRARADKRKGLSASTQAGEFVREEIHHVRAGKHGVRSTKQAIAIGLSKARRAGVKLPVPKKASKAVKRQASRDLAKARKHTKPNPRRSRAMHERLEREGHSATSRKALSRHAHRAAVKRGPKARSASAQKAARTRARTKKSAHP